MCNCVPEVPDEPEVHGTINYKIVLIGNWELNTSKHDGMELRTEDSESSDAKLRTDD